MSIAGIDIRTNSSGVRFSVRVAPKASKNQVTGVIDGAVRIRLAASPVDGAANRELCQFLSKLLSVPRRAVRIISGERSRTKTIEVNGITADDIDQLIPLIA